MSYEKHLTSDLTTKLTKNIQTGKNSPQDIEKTVKDVIEDAAKWREDKFLYRTAVIVLGILTLIAAGGSIYLTLELPDKPIPDVLVALGSAAVGALVGLFAPSPAK